jgi:hypothetical protein
VDEDDSVPRTAHELAVVVVVVVAVADVADVAAAERVEEDHLDDTVASEEIVVLVVEDEEEQWKPTDYSPVEYLRHCWVKMVVVWVAVGKDSLVWPFDPIVILQPLQLRAQERESERASQ